MGDVTKLLVDWRAGDQKALEELMPIVYRQLHLLARRYMAGERVEHTLQASALVNEAYLKLIDVQKVQWQNRAHFFGVSAQLMRRILVDIARSRNYQKRGAGARHVTLNDEAIARTGRTPDVVAIDEALTALEQLDPRKARVIEMRFFAGLSVEETAEALQVSRQTVIRDWNVAKAWLHRELRGAQTT